VQQGYQGLRKPVAFSSELGYLLVEALIAHGLPSLHEAIRGRYWYSSLCSADDSSRLIEPLIRARLLYGAMRLRKITMSSPSA
jgi:hypothetical protein